MLETRDLSVRFGGHFAVHAVNARFLPGTLTAIVGPNGAGKTTSFYMIVGLVPLDSGEINLNGQEISHLPIHERAKLGLSYLPQEASVFRKLNVEENIQEAFFAMNDELFDRTENP